MKTEFASALLLKLRDIGYRISLVTAADLSGLHLYVADFSSWHLRFSARTPLIWIPAEIALQLTPDEICALLTDIARSRRWREQECLVLLDGPGAALRQLLAAVAYPRFVLCDLDAQQRILVAASPSHALLDVIIDQLPLSTIAPYQLGAVPQSNVFFGREPELGRLIRNPNASFAITGIRRVGKTWLLHEVRNRLLAAGEEPSRLLYVDCSPFPVTDALVTSVVRDLDVREFMRLEKVGVGGFDFGRFLKNIAKRHGGSITLFLDEIDSLLQHSRATYLRETIRSAMNGGYCRVIVAGFQDLMKEVCDKLSPFYFLFELIELRPFLQRDTRDMVVKPMNSLRIRFAEPDLTINRIHTDTHGLPYFVQHYCLELIRQLELRDDRTIRLSDLIPIYQSDSFKTLVINTFRDSTNAIDRLLVYTLLSSFPAGKDTYSQEEMVAALESYSIPSPLVEVDRICDRLVLGGFLDREGSVFRFALPVFPPAMRANYNLKYLAMKTHEEMRK